jgi:hypothetical protein
MWNRRPLGVLLTGSWLAFGILEGIGIAVDQWFGHQADPVSPHASIEVIPMMIGLAVVNLIGLYFYLRRQSVVVRTFESVALRETASRVHGA